MLSQMSWQDMGSSERLLGKSTDALTAQQQQLLHTARDGAPGAKASVAVLEALVRVLDKHFVVGNVCT